MTVTCDETCSWCGERIQPHEANPALPRMHWECGIRSACGSVAHIEGRCSCYVRDSTDHDPSGMTLREAARAAATAFERKRRESPVEAKPRT